MHFLLGICITCIAVCDVLPFAASQLDPTENYDRDLYLDYERNFRMFWNVNGTHITFELHVRTTGWIGIGISPSGSMRNADIHVGWIKDGKAYITDRQGPDYNGYPFLDYEQNLELLGGRECDGFTMIKFRRQLAACEQGADRRITSDTTRVIYAYGVIDPTLEDLFFTDKHRFSNRGTRSVLLLTKFSPPREDVETFPTMDIRHDGSLIPTSSTYYNCIMWEMPPLDRKHHIIEVLPIIDQEYIDVIHHMVVYQCRAVLQEPSDVGKNSACYSRELIDLQFCVTVWIGWAVGASAVVSLPDDAGIPIGIPGESRYFALETHYDNPRGREIRDTSGFRLIYTSGLRPIDVGIMNVGHVIFTVGLVIPPRSDSFKVYGDCEAECIAGGMDAGGVDSIRILTAMPHSHLAGRGIALRHIRNGTELAPVINDDGYDFNFQEFRPLNPHVEVRRGDSLQVVCDYSTKERNTVTEGGVRTIDEMCLVFFFYYPRIPLHTCMSIPTTGGEVSAFILGLTGLRRINEDKNYFEVNLQDVLVTGPEDKANQTLKQVIDEFPWTDQDRQVLSEGLRQGSHGLVCNGGQPRLPVNSIRNAITIDQPYVPEEDPVCTAPSTGFENDQNELTCPP